MKHFLATRFNLKVENWKTAKDGSPVLTEKWLEDRFELFEKYCFPSVVNQNNKNFFWFIYFDIDTPSFYKQKINLLFQNQTNFKAVFIDGVTNLQSTFTKNIEELLDEKDEFIITTRLDNDDSIHKNFIDIIQKLAPKKNETVIDVKRGYQIEIINDIVEYREFNFSFNPFLSFVESSKEFDTIFSREHLDWRKEKNIIGYTKTPLWIQVIHERNKLNETRTSIPLICTLSLKDFGITSSLNNRSCMSVFYKNTMLNLNKLFSRTFKKIKQIFE